MSLNEKSPTPPVTPKPSPSSSVSVELKEHKTLGIKEANLEHVESTGQNELPKQKYYVVMSEPDAIPMAMFTARMWAEDWKWKYCRTAIIEEFDLIIRR